MTWRTRAYTAFGFATILALTLGIGVWGSWASLAGAVVAQGRIEIEARSQIVQHPDGGVVREIRVRDGDKVDKGDPLLVLDGSELTSQQVILNGQLTELRARAARLEAERDGLAQAAFPADLARRADTEPGVAEVLAGEDALFAARLTTLKEATSSYDEQRKQIDNEIAGQMAQIAALSDQIAFLGDELTSSETLLEKGLVEAPRVLALRRENARLAGTKAETEAAVARNRGRIAQIAVEVLRLAATRREEAVTELREVQGRIAELSEQLKAIETKLSRLVLTAPMAGLVHDLNIFSLGAVIRPADPVLYIVPQDDALTISAKIDVYHIDSVFSGQDATLRFSTFNARTTPEIAAAVIRVSADTSTDERTGMQFYTTELRASPAEVARLDGQQLLPGMPVEVFIQTGARSPLSYIAKPFTDYFGKAFRE